MELVRVRVTNESKSTSFAHRFLCPPILKKAHECGVCVVATALAFSPLAVSIWRRGPPGPRGGAPPPPPPPGAEFLWACFNRPKEARRRHAPPPSAVSPCTGPRSPTHLPPFAKVDTPPFSAPGAVGQASCWGGGVVVVGGMPPLVWCRAPFFFSDVVRWRALGLRGVGCLATHTGSPPSPPPHPPQPPPPPPRRRPRRRQGTCTVVARPVGRSVVGGGGQGSGRSLNFSPS